MKDLNKKKLSGGDELVRGNNRKFLIYDNFFKKNYSNNVTPLIPEASLIFLDLANAVTLLGINDVNDVAEWNLILNWDYAAFLDQTETPIEFESVVVEGNKVSLIPYSNDYSVIKGFDWVYFDGVGEYLLENVIIYYDGIDLNYVEVDGVVVAQNMDTSKFNLTGNDDFVLQMGSNGVTSFTGSNLHNVKTLRLEFNGLTEFDGTNLGLTNIKNLTLLGNSISSFNATGLGSLEVLNLDSNDLVEFNPSGNLNNLKSLSVSFNLLSSINYPLPSIETISFYGCQFTTIDLSQYTTLKKVLMQANQLTSININGLTNLTEIRVEDNALTTLNISSSPNLTILILNGNNLTTTSVNNILATLVTNGKLNGVLWLFQGTNAAPSGQGITDKNTLISRGWTVTTN